MSSVTYPLFDLRLWYGGVELRPARENDLPGLAAMQPDNVEHDPSAELFPAMTARQNRERLLYQGYWRSMGTWSPNLWCLHFVVEYHGDVVGLQTLEGERFPTLRTVDSASWLAVSARGKGIGVAMRTAVLGLAFDHLGALAAVSSAATDNTASLGVSRSIGYRENGISLNDSGHGLVKLQHLRLTEQQWRESGRERTVGVSGYDACKPWFAAGHTG